MPSWFQKYQSNYLYHLKKLGYGDHKGDFDAFFVKKAFLDSWTQPGFHNFWRYWNPGIGFLMLKTYIAFGGKKYKIFATYITFIICAVAHITIVYPFLGYSHVIIITFVCFATLTLLSKFLAKTLNQQRWNILVNTIINISLVVLSFKIGFVVNMLCY